MNDIIIIIISSSSILFYLQRVYTMTNAPRGFAVIYNTYASTQCLPRKGSQVDVNTTFQLFSQLGFKCEAYQDLKPEVSWI